MNQRERRSYLIRELLRENPQYKDIKIPAGDEAQKQLLHGLMNSHTAGGRSGEFLDVQEKYLRQEARNKENVKSLRDALADADAIVIGAGAGLSASAGFLYTGERFDRYFQDFAARYHFTDMYFGGFYPYQTLEEHWAYWSRYIYINRYMDAPKPVYQRLYELVQDKDYFVLTTNVDHCFQKAGFDKRRLFYTQGDYGLFQCSRPCHQNTYDNESIVREMVEAQGYTIGPDGTLLLPEGGSPKMTIPSALVPYCPKCKEPMSMNLRADAAFVEDEGWSCASKRYVEFLRGHQDQKVLFLETAVGFHTPTIIKYSFWRMTYEWKKATYVCLNDGEAYAPDELRKKSICINGDIGEILCELNAQPPDAASCTTR